MLLIYILFLLISTINGVVIDNNQVVLHENNYYCKADLKSTECLSNLWDLLCTNEAYDDFYTKSAVDSVNDIVSIKKRIILDYKCTLEFDDCFYLNHDCYWDHDGDVNTPNVMCTLEGQSESPSAISHNNEDGVCFDCHFTHNCALNIFNSVCKSTNYVLSRDNYKNINNIWDLHDNFYNNICDSYKLNVFEQARYASTSNFNNYDFAIAVHEVATLFFLYFVLIYIIYISIEYFYSYDFN